MPNRRTDHHQRSEQGWRIGYLATPANDGGFAAAAGTLHSQMLSSIPAFCMPPIIEALENGAAEVERMRRSFAHRGGLMHEKLDAIDGIRCARPAGAFYCFPELSASVAPRRAGH